MTRVVCTGVVPVALPPQEAFSLFTAHGEREWADGWDPRFPAEVEDDAVAGTVFETAQTIWIVIAAEPARFISYARVTPGDRAGTVTVELAPAPDATTLAQVTYELTALSRDGSHALLEFEANYDAFLRHWRDAIDTALRLRGSGPGQARA